MPSGQPSSEVPVELEQGQAAFGQDGLIFPLIVCILPVLFIVLLGPTILSIMGSM